MPQVLNFKFQILNKSLALFKSIKLTTQWCRCSVHKIFLHGLFLNFIGCCRMLQIGKWREIYWIVAHFLNNVLLNLRYFQVKGLKSKWNHESLVLLIKLSWKSFVITSSRVQSHQICDSRPSHMTESTPLLYFVSKSFCGEKFQESLLPQLMFFY